MGNLAFGCSGLSLVYFFFSLVQREQARAQRFGWQPGRWLLQASLGFQTTSLLLFFLTIPHIVQTLSGPKNLFVFSFLSFFYFSFAFLQSLIGWFYFLLKHIHNLRAKEVSFGGILLFVLPRVRVEIPILGQGLWLKSQGLAKKACERQDMMYVGIIF